MSANAKQIGGKHYKSVAIQPWDYILANNIPFLEGNVIKYITRWREKNGIEDLKKAQHSLDKLIEYELTRQSGPGNVDNILGSDYYIKNPYAVPPKNGVGY